VWVNGDPPQDDADPQWRSEVIDVSALSPSQLAAADDSVLAASLRRLADDLADPGEPIAGFNSAL
jgi:FXSXX-COOH protein